MGDFKTTKETTWVEDSDLKIVIKQFLEFHDEMIEIVDDCENPDQLKRIFEGFGDTFWDIASGVEVTNQMLIKWEEIEDSGLYLSDVGKASSSYRLIEDPDVVFYGLFVQQQRGHPRRLIGLYPHKGMARTQWEKLELAIHHKCKEVTISRGWLK